MADVWERICEYRSIWSIVFRLNLALLVMLGISLLFVERGTSSFYISLVTFGSIAVSLVGSGFLLWQCEQQREELSYEGTASRD